MPLKLNGSGPGRAAIAAWSTIACVLMLVAGCENDAAFETAERANTPAAWEEYLRQHPDGNNAREARERLAARIDDREWFRADEAHTQAAYESYLRAYPQGIHSHEALLAIANLNLVVPPPKKDAVGEVQLVAPPEPVLRKPSTGAIERAAKSASPPPAHPEPAAAAAAAKVAPARATAPPPAEKVAATAGEAKPKAPPSVAAAPVPPAARVAAAGSETRPKAPAAPAAAKVAAVASDPKPAVGANPSAATGAPAKPARAAPVADPSPATVAGDAPAALRAEDARGYRVQLGAFFTEGSATAEKVWTQLQSRYAPLRDRHPIIAAARSADGRSIYRLQVGGLERDAAESLCVSLSAQHDPCIVIAPLKGRTP